MQTAANSLQYFGTDGIRGKVGQEPITEAFFQRLGRALALYLAADKPQKPSIVLIGRDTRSSSALLEAALIKGLTASGAQAVSLGVLPTAAVGLSVRVYAADLGLIITASHNSAEDNGIKILSHLGFKLTPTQEATLEAYLQQVLESPLPDFHPLPGASANSLPQEDLEPRPPTQHSSSLAALVDPAAALFYTQHLQTCLPKNALLGWRIVLDTANGAAFETAPAVLNALGAHLTIIGAQPNGTNINDSVGSEHPDALVATVQRTQAQLGIALDGDADRVVLCDEAGQLLPGEALLGILALHAFQQQTLAHNTLVTTVQSNTGLDHTLGAHGIQIVRTAVGDRNVLHCMQERGCNVGGEASGHIVLLPYLSLADGLLAALKVMKVMLHTGKPLSELRAAIQLFPQLTANLLVSHKKPLETLPHLATAIQAINHQLQGQGRALVRYSGTEPKLRLLVEGPDKHYLQTSLDNLKAAARTDTLIM